MENTSIYRLATKAFKEISQSNERLFFKTFKDYLKDKKMFFGHFTGLDFYFFFFYCYFMWSAKRVLSIEEVNDLMNNILMAELIYTDFDEEVMETCENCGGDGVEECVNCDGDKKVECPDCDGTGEVDGEECFNCSGMGEVECGVCDGDGSFECDYCEGLGQVTDESQKHVVKHIKFTTNEDEYQNVVKSYENSEILNEDIVDNLNYLAIPFDSTILAVDTLNLEADFYYVDDVVTNPERIGSLIKYLYYQDFSPDYNFDYIFQR